MLEMSREKYFKEKKNNTGGVKQHRECFPAQLTKLVVVIINMSRI